MDLVKMTHIAVWTSTLPNGQEKSAHLNARRSRGAAPPLGAGALRVKSQTKRMKVRTSL